MTGRKRIRYVAWAHHTRQAYTGITKADAMLSERTKPNE